MEWASDFDGTLLRYVVTISAMDTLTMFYVG